MTTNKVCGKGKCKFTDEFCASGDCPYDHYVLKNQKKINILEGNVKEDDINVTNNVAQLNSQDLTEQLKKGELPEDAYYVTYYKNDTPEVDIYRRVYSLYDDSKVRFTIPQVNKVLAPVPSYEEYLSLTYAKEEDEKIIAEYEKENQKLKELLKECNKTFFEIRLSLSSGKINSVFDLSYQRENDINEALK